MEKLFLLVFNLSVIGTAAIAIVVVARLLLSRLPKRYAYLLWLAPAYLLTGLNLFQSRRSFGLRQTAGQQITGATFTGVPDSLFQTFEGSVPGLAPTPYASVNPLQLLVWLLANLWVVGMVVLAAYSLWSVLQLHLRLRGAEQLEGNVYLCRTIKTPFVMGLLRPRIYLPDGLSDVERNYILQHERTHIRRGDHLVKPLAFLLLCVHWFNPFCWLAFYLFSRDMEMSCDEAVIRKLGSEIKQPYAGSLLALAAPRTIFAGSPLAFGEGHTGKRIQNLLDYKKPALWATIVVVILLGWLMWGLVADLPPEEQGWLGQLYANRTQYIGDNSKLSQIADRLNMPEGFTPDGGIKLETSGSRNRAELLYLDTSAEIGSLSKQEYSELQRNAIMAFSLVQNMDAITFTWQMADRQSGTMGYTATREQATRVLGDVDPWERSGTLAEFEHLYNELNDRIAKGTLDMEWRLESVVQGETVVEPVAAVTKSTKLPAPIFTITAPPSDPMARDRANADMDRAVVAALADSYLSYYTQNEAAQNWKSHTVTDIPGLAVSSPRDGSPASKFRISVVYDLELSDNPEANPTSWPANSNNPVVTTADGKKVLTDNSVYLYLQQLEATQYALYCVVSYNDLLPVPEDLLATPHFLASTVQYATMDVIESYRDGGLTVHTTLGAGFAQAPAALVWSDYFYLKLQWGGTRVIQVTASVGEGYRMMAEVALEGEDLVPTITSTRFEKIA